MIKEIVEICGNRTRQTIDMGNFYYVYIPLSKKEKKLFAENMLFACWRILKTK
jgi:hypothetical protein